MEMDLQSQVPTNTMLSKKKPGPKQCMINDSISTYFENGQIKSMILEVRIVVPLGERKEYDWERLQMEFLKVMEILYFLT